MAGCVRWLAVASVFCAMVGASVGGAFAEPNMTMRVGGSTSAPIGHTEFCKNFRDECAPSGGAVPLLLSEERWRELIDVNRNVNRTITPVTDLEFYHRDEVWTLPTAYGDCEDYVLLKRRELIRRGWPTGSLLVDRRLRRGRRRPRRPARRHVAGRAGSRQQDRCRPPVARDRLSLREAAVGDGSAALGFGRRPALDDAEHRRAPLGPSQTSSRPSR